MTEKRVPLEIDTSVPAENVCRVVLREFGYSLDTAAPSHREAVRRVAAYFAGRAFRQEPSR